MQITGVSIVRGSTEPGVEVEFRGEGGDSVLIQLKTKETELESDREVIECAKKVLDAIVVAGDSSAAA